MLESVQDLRNGLEKKGSGLLVSHSKPEEFIPSLLGPEQNTLIYQEEVCSEELKVEHALSKRLGKNCTIETRWGSTIYHYEDLLVPPEESASIYGNYARKSEGSKIRETVRPPTKSSLPLPGGFEEHMKYMPKYEEFGFEKVMEKDERAALDFKGGETEGLKRLEDYLWNYQGMKDYKKLRNGFLGANFSSKLSPWMANGCLSPR